MIMKAIVIGSDEMNVIREATQEDYDRLQAMTQRWIDRKWNDGRPYPHVEALVEAIQDMMDRLMNDPSYLDINSLLEMVVDRFPKESNLRYELSLWQEYVALALRVPLTLGVPYIAYGKVVY